MLPKVYILSDMWRTKKVRETWRKSRLTTSEKKARLYKNNAVAKYRMQLHPSLFMIVKHNECAV